MRSLHIFLMHWICCVRFSHFSAFREPNARKFLLHRILECITYVLLRVPLYVTTYFYLSCFPRSPSIHEDEAPHGWMEVQRASSVRHTQSNPRAAIVGHAHTQIRQISLWDSKEPRTFRVDRSDSGRIVALACSGSPRMLCNGCVRTFETRSLSRAISYTACPAHVIN